MEPLGRGDQQARRLLDKALSKALCSRAKGTGWKVSQGCLFREDDGWFVEARPAVYVTACRSTVSLHAKPMAVDPIFWEIVDLVENNSLPLSFRAFGAWTVRTPQIVDLDLDELGKDVFDLADAVIAVAAIEVERWKSQRSAAGLLEELKQLHARDERRPYLSAEVCLLVLLGDRQTAKEICVSARECGLSGGFQVGDQTFVDLALEWLDTAQPIIH
jgi:hypothetical protein